MVAEAAQDPTGGLTDGPPHTQAPRPVGSLPSRVLYPEEHNQHFYVPSVQPFLPYQWSIPPPYVPYGGFTGLGYGTVMPSLLLPPCLEVPGYMLPHAQLHMLDYRHMSPHMAPTISHQAHRFRFQNSAPLNRVMVSSEVQTEPLCHSSTQDLCRCAASSHTGSESGRGTGCGSPVSTSPSFSENKSVACPEETSILAQHRVVATNTINKTDLSAAPKSEIILQAERVQIKCSNTPSGLKTAHTKNTQLASDTNGDLLQSSLRSIKSTEDVVMCSYQSLAFKKDKQGVEAGKLRYSSKHCLPLFKEITMVRGSPPCGTCKAHNKSSRSNAVQGIKANKSSLMQTPRASKLAKNMADGNSCCNVQFKILRLPSDMQHLNQPCQLDASIWSVESLVPYAPSAKWMENGLLTPQKPLSTVTEPSEFLSESNQTSTDSIPVGNNLQISPTTKHGQQCQLEASIWSVDSLMQYVPSNEWMMENGLLTPQKTLSPVIEPSEVVSEWNETSTDSIPVGKNLQISPTKHGQQCQLEASIWSVDSLMQYVPSNEWMMENGLLTPQKPKSRVTEISEVLSKPNQMSTDGFPLGMNQQTGLSTKHEDSLETHSPYRPSTSWLADFGNVYYYSKLPVVRQQLGSFGKSPVKQLHKMAPVSPATKSMQVISPKTTSLRYEKKTRNQKQDISSSLSNQKRCSFNYCKHTAKSRSRIAGCGESCGWISHSTLEDKIHYCTSCKSTTGMDHRKLPFPDSLGCKSEVSAEMKMFDEKRAFEGVVRAQNILGSNSSKCHAARQVKQSEQIGLCEYCFHHASPCRVEFGAHGQSICQKNEDEEILSTSWRWRDPEQRLTLQRLQKDKAWKGGMQESDIESSRMINNDESKECAHTQEITVNGDTVLTTMMTTVTQHAHPMERVKAH